MTVNNLEDLQTICKNEKEKVCSQVCEIHASAGLGHTYVELNWNLTEEYLYKSISIRALFILRISSNKAYQRSAHVLQSMNV